MPVGNDQSLTEMAIVDIFTQLIFDAESSLDVTAALVVDALGQVEPYVVGASRRDLSEYLRAMPVDEMIEVVGRVKDSLDHPRDLLITDPNTGASILRH